MRSVTVSDSVSDHPVPTRQHLLRSVFEPSPLATVAEAVSMATEHETQVYVERLSDGWRWSLAHRGGSYPLLRITARFLQVNYRQIMIGFRTLPNGFSVLCEDPNAFRTPGAVIDFKRRSSPASVERRIVDVLGDTLSGSA
jgi:hypothetical protein